MEDRILLNEGRRFDLSGFAEVWLVLPSSNTHGVLIYRAGAMPPGGLGWQPIPARLLIEVERPEDPEVIAQWQKAVQKELHDLIR